MVLWYVDLRSCLLVHSPFGLIYGIMTRTRLRRIRSTKIWSISIVGIPWWTLCWAKIHQKRFNFDRRFQKWIGFSPTLRLLDQINQSPSRNAYSRIETLLQIQANEEATPASYLWETAPKSYQAQGLWKNHLFSISLIFFLIPSLTFSIALEISPTRVQRNLTKIENPS